jgi:phosphoribosylamine--glycine ligase
MVDTASVLPVALSLDFKRVGDDDAGPNTGGMGAYSPLPWLDEGTEAGVWEIVADTVTALRDGGIAYSWLLYTGVMLTPHGPRVLEYNCRFGDPETEAVIPRLRADLAELLHACAAGRLSDVKVDLSEDAAVTVVLASGGYPGRYETGVEIDGLGAAAASPDAVVFHAGTVERAGRVVTAGGRVLAVTGWGPTVPDARARAYGAASHISFEGMTRRSDIAARSAEGGPRSEMEMERT